MASSRSGEISATATGTFVDSVDVGLLHALGVASARGVVRTVAEDSQEEFKSLVSPMGLGNFQYRTYNE